MVTTRWVPSEPLSRHSSARKPTAAGGQTKTATRSAITLVSSAVATLDYRSPTCEADIHAPSRATRWGACSTASPAPRPRAMCHAAIGSRDYVALDAVSAHVKCASRDVSADWVMAPGHDRVSRAAGGRLHYGQPASPALRGLAAHVFGMTEALIGRGALRRSPVQVRSGGLVGCGGPSESERSCGKGRSRECDTGRVGQPAVGWVLFCRCSITAALHARVA